MERLNLSGLKRLVIKLKEYFSILIKGMHPTVKVRPSRAAVQAGRDPVYLNCTDDGWVVEEQEGGSMSIPIYVKTLNLSFTIKCDSRDAAMRLIHDGSYSLRLSYISRKYTYAKWVCPSNYPGTTGQPGLQDWCKDTIWDKITLTSDNCNVDSVGNITINIGPVRDIMCTTIWDEDAGEFKPVFTRPGEANGAINKKYVSSLYYPYIERALLLGSEVAPVYNIRCFHKKPIHFKGVIPYLQDIEQNDITMETIALVPSNAYSCKIKASVWHNGVELPGASIGSIQVTKKRNAENQPLILYTYKEDTANFK